MEGRTPEGLSGRAELSEMQKGWSEEEREKRAVTLAYQGRGNSATIITHHSDDVRFSNTGLIQQ